MILVALELGMAAGLGAAMLATALVVVWATTAPVDLGIVGIVTRSAVFLAAGLVAGRFSDHMRRVFASQDRLLAAGLELARLGDAHRLGAAVLDRVRELPGVRGARLAIGGRPAGERGALGGRPERFALSSRGADRGVLEVELRGGPEERAAIAMLALQASVALENQRLLESERERVRLQAALGDAEERIVERGDALRTVLGGQELERREVARADRGARPPWRRTAAELAANRGTTDGGSVARTYLRPMPEADPQRGAPPYAAAGVTTQSPGPTGA